MRDMALLALEETMSEFATAEKARMRSIGSSIRTLLLDNTNVSTCWAPSNILEKAVQHARHPAAPSIRIDLGTGHERAFFSALHFRRQFATERPNNLLVAYQK